jgi:hypothetical protein
MRERESFWRLSSRASKNPFLDQESPFDSHLAEDFEALLPEVGPCCKHFVTRRLPTKRSSILATSQVQTSQNLDEVLLNFTILYLDKNWEILVVFTKFLALAFDFYCVSAFYRQISPGRKGCDLPSKD